MNTNSTCQLCQVKEVDNSDDICKHGHLINVEPRVESEVIDTSQLFLFETYVENLRDQMGKEFCAGSIFSDAFVYLGKCGDTRKRKWRRSLNNLKNLKRSNRRYLDANFISSVLIDLKDEEAGTKFVEAFGNEEGTCKKLLEQLICVKYEVDSSHSRQIQSFQRILVGFVTILTMRKIVKPLVLVEESNRIYMLVGLYHKKLFRTYLDCLMMLINRGSVDDKNLSSESYLKQHNGTKFVPICFTQVIIPIIHLHLILGSQLKNVIHETSFKESVERLNVLVNLWARQRASLSISLDTRYNEKLLIQECRRLNMMIEMANISVSSSNTIEQAEQIGNITLGKDSWDAIWDGSSAVVPPEDVILKDGTRGKRHDNDYREINQISIVPTIDELFSAHEPSLPGNVVFHPKAHWLPAGPIRWLDTNFRLYREDMCRTLRESVQKLEHYLLRMKRDNKTMPQKAKLVRSFDLNILLYPLKKINIGVFHYKHIWRFGMGIEISFNQLYISEHDRKTFWENSQRLSKGGLVALVALDTKVEVVLCRVVDRYERNLVKSPSCIILQLFDASKYSEINYWGKRLSSGFRVAMVEFNSLMLHAYEPVLRALKHTPPWDKSLVDYLAPTQPRSANSVKVNPPLYTANEGFVFDLNVIPGLNRQLILDPHSCVSKLACTHALCEESTLQRDQVGAIVNTLCSQVACIQGLPGSGKSFIGSLITQVILKARVSPILIVCYTNHALDQFLCNLLDAGISKIIRIGRQSKEPRMEKLNLSVKRGNAKLPKAIRELHQQLDNIASRLRKLVTRNQQKDYGWNALNQFLACNYRNTYDRLREKHEEKNNIEDILLYWLKGGELVTKTTRLPKFKNRSIELILLEEDVWKLNKYERSLLYKEWIDEFRQATWKEISSSQVQYNQILEKIKSYRNRNNVNVLKKAEIIGVTTTGAASHQDLLSKVGVKVVMCEEAGEVLEAQTIPCLTSSCQQLILIGDHKQLRSHIANYGLSIESKPGKKHRLDVSMFERLVADPLSGIPFDMLTEQHRMRPEISQFIRELFYPNVCDADETERYPPVKGVDTPVFFVTHTEPEDSITNYDENTMRSHSNTYEIKYVIGLLKFLLQQGYLCNDIAILTPYISQLKKLTAELAKENFIVELNELDTDQAENELEEEELRTWNKKYADILHAKKVNLSRSVKVATIDNFQGEEATIVLVSLVRAAQVGPSLDEHTLSQQSTIGFLKTPNRINVLMSRAKHGLYLVGQAELLKEKSKEWKCILEMCESKGYIGKGLPIHCERHPGDCREICKPDDFKIMSPDGGCIEPCRYLLPNCGHACPKRCHIDQEAHNSILCPLPCQRLQDPCGHACPKLCGDICGICQIDIGTIILPCGHLYEQAKCFQAYMLDKISCATLVPFTMPICNHEQLVEYSLAFTAEQNPVGSRLKCKKKCGAILPCSHLCEMDCRICFKNAATRLGLETKPVGVTVNLINKDHGSCNKKCNKILSCCHPCNAACLKHIGYICPPCTYSCEVFDCKHSECTKLCSEPCSACNGPC